MSRRKAICNHGKKKSIHAHTQIYQPEKRKHKKHKHFGDGDVCDFREGGERSVKALLLITHDTEHGSPSQKKRTEVKFLHRTIV